MAEYTDVDTFVWEIAATDRLILGQFSADWCPPCQSLRPTMKALATEYEGKVRILKLNLDAARSLAKEYGVKTIPALILFRKGTKLAKFEGTRTLSRLSNFLDAHLEAAS